MSGLPSGAGDRVESYFFPVGVHVAVSLASEAAAAGASAAVVALGTAAVSPARMAAAEVARSDASGRSGLAW